MYVGVISLDKNKNNKFNKINKSKDIFKIDDSIIVENPDDDKYFKIYEYNREYKTKEGEIKLYKQIQRKPVAPTKEYPVVIIKKDEEAENIVYYAKDNIRLLKRYSSLLEELEYVIKKILQYKCYNKKNFNNRLYRLEGADEMTTDDKKLLRKVMKIQKSIAGQMSNKLDGILEIYEVLEAERKEKEEEISKIYGGR